MKEPRLARCATCDARVLLLNAAVLDGSGQGQVICGTCVIRYEEVGALVTRALWDSTGTAEEPPPWP